MWFLKRYIRIAKNIDDNAKCQLGFSTRICINLCKFAKVIKA